MGAHITDLHKLGIISQFGHDVGGFKPSFDLLFG